MSFRVTWYECVWWYEERFATREAAEEFAAARSWQKKTEARLLVAGQWGAMGLLGDLVPPPCSPSG
jgi:hypothetical protein